MMIELILAMFVLVNATNATTTPEDCPDRNSTAGHDLLYRDWCDGYSFQSDMTNSTSSSSDCPPDHYGPGDTDDLRLRPIECLPDYCKNYYGDSGMYDLLERGPEC